MLLSSQAYCSHPKQSAIFNVRKSPIKACKLKKTNKFKPKTDTLLNIYMCNSFMNSIPSGLTVNTIFFRYCCCWVYFVISLPFFCTSAFFTLSFWFTKLLWFYFVLFVVVALAFFPFRSFRLEFRLHIIFVSVFFCFIIHFIILYRLWCVCVCVFRVRVRDYCNFIHFIHELSWGFFGCQQKKRNTI